MPKLTEEELQAYIESGRIGAISVDTSVFDRYQCNLHYATLQKLGQFGSTHILVQISEVVANEVQAHLKRDAVRSQRDLKAALAAHIKRWRLAEPADSATHMMLEDDPDDWAARQFQSYIEAIGAEVVPAARSHDVAHRVMQSYFETAAPFETGEKKKHEFPDAFALISLEEAAVEQGNLTLCISSDAGWQNFADQSEHLICVGELDPVLDLFNEAGRAIALRAMDLVSFNRPLSVMTEIRRAFEYHLDDNNFDISVEDCPLNFDADPISAILQTLDWSESTPRVISEDAESITLTTTVRAQIEFTVNFGFYVHDSVDRDDVSMGSDEVSTTRWLKFDVVLTVSRDWKHEPDRFEASVSRRGMTALFGRIDPFRHENPTHERF